MGKLNQCPFPVPQETEFQKMIEFLDTAWYAKDEIVPCLIGPVGIGKTAAVREHAQNVGAQRIVTIIASQILPNEVSGITMPDAETKAMEIYDHFRLSSLEDGDILFFDELLEADQLVLSACLTLIESRMLMSGRLLPDIQIIAATNPSIQPNVLKENIRQRFMFQKFELDKPQVRYYIWKETGCDVGEEILAQIKCEGDDYNILSPRSLTKLVKWELNVPRDQLDSVATVIDRTWKSMIGTKIKERVLMIARLDSKTQAKREMAKAFSKLAGDKQFEEGVLPNDQISEDMFDEMDFHTIIEVLEDSGFLDQVKEMMAASNAPEEVKEEEDIKF